VARRYPIPVLLLFWLTWSAGASGRDSYPDQQQVFEPQFQSTPAFHIESFPKEGPRPSETFEDAQLALLEKLNRLSRPHLDQREELVVPDNWNLNELAYSPLPQFCEWALEHPKALVVSKDAQVFGAYEYGRLTRWGPVSTGRRGHRTPAGLYHLNWNSRGHRSSVNPDWHMPWYFNFHNTRGLSFHAYDLPGYAASHACVRLLTRDARWLYEWGESWELDASGQQVLEKGTPVLIVGEYNHGEPPPWLSASYWDRPVLLPEMQDEGPRQAAR
jgi:hypothetical protein